MVDELQEADVWIRQGKTIVEVCNQLGITDKTYFRWRTSHGGLAPCHLSGLLTTDRERDVNSRVKAFSKKESDKTSDLDQKKLAGQIPGYPLERGEITPDFRFCVKVSAIGATSTTAVQQPEPSASCCPRPLTAAT